MKKAIIVLAMLLMCCIFSGGAMAAIPTPPPDPGTGSDSASGIFIKYDKDLKTIVPIAASSVQIISGTEKNYVFADGTPFKINETIVSGIIHIGVKIPNAKGHFEDEVYLQKTRDSIKSFCSDADIKADAYGAITEAFRQNKDSIPEGEVTLLYECSSA